MRLTRLPVFISIFFLSPILCLFSRRANDYSRYRVLDFLPFESNVSAWLLLNVTLIVSQLAFIFTPIDVDYIVFGHTTYLNVKYNYNERRQHDIWRIEMTCCGYTHLANDLLSTNLKRHIRKHNCSNYACKNCNLNICAMQVNLFCAEINVYWISTLSFSTFVHLIPYMSTYIFNTTI